jgi:hypothetical protein
MMIEWKKNADKTKEQRHPYSGKDGTPRSVSKRAGRAHLIFEKRYIFHQREIEGFMAVGALVESEDPAAADTCMGKQAVSPKQALLFSQVGEAQNW